MATTSYPQQVSLPSKPPSGDKQIKNIYVTSEGKIKIVFEDTPVP